MLLVNEKDFLYSLIDKKETLSSFKIYENYILIEFLKEDKINEVILFIIDKIPKIKTIKASFIIKNNCEFLSKKHKGGFFLWEYQIKKR